MTYPKEFREKVLAVKEKKGLSVRATAELFSVGTRSIIRWCQRIDPMRTRNKPTITINMNKLAEDVKKYPDSYMHERAKRLGVSKSGINHALKRMGVSYKKKPKASKGERRYAAALSQENKIS